MFATCLFTGDSNNPINYTHTNEVTGVINWSLMFSFNYAVFVAYTA